MGKSKTQDPKSTTQNPAAPGGGKSTAEIVRKSNQWRDSYNPLRSLTIGKVLSLFEDAERGAFPELQLLLRKAEKRFPILKGFIERLLSSLEELDWDVKIKKDLPPGATKQMAEAQKKFLASRYELIENLTEAIGQLALAEIRGYTILQKHRYEDGGPNDGAVKELYWLEPWCFSKDGYYGDFYYNADSKIGIGLGSCAPVLGEENRVGSDALPREGFVIRQVDAPLYEIALLAMVNWLMARKDHAAFVEIFGLPNSVVIMPPNIPAGKESDYQAAAEKVADGISGALPNGADVKFPTSGAKADPPFPGFCDAQEKDVVMAGTGGQLTMLANDKAGLGDGPAKQHDDAWCKIGTAKARKVNETLQRDFDVPELEAEFPGQPICVYFELSVQDEEDESSVADRVQKLEASGWQTDAAEVSEKSGLTVTRKVIAAFDVANPAPKPGQPGAPGNPLFNRAPANGDPAPFASAVAADLQPVLAALNDRMDAIVAITDPALRLAKFRALWAELAPLRQDITRDPASARVLEKMNADALKEGLIR